MVNEISSGGKVDYWSWCLFAGFMFLTKAMEMNAEITERSRLLASWV